MDMLRKITAAVGGVALLAGCGADTNVETTEPSDSGRTAEDTRPDAERTAEAEVSEPRATVEPEQYDGMSGNDGVFTFEVNEAYVDEDGYITDGGGFSENAPTGMEYWIFNVQITNDSDAPQTWNGIDNTALDVEERSYASDSESEWVVCDDYCGERLNPGATVETDVIYVVPEGTSLVEVSISSGAPGSEPVDLVP